MTRLLLPLPVVVVATLMLLHPSLLLSPSSVLAVSTRTIPILLRRLSGSLRCHQIPTSYLTFEVLQRYSTRVLKFLPNVQNGLFPDHSVPVDEFFPSVLVRDFKPSRNQLYRFRHRLVFNSHVVRVHESLFSRRTLLESNLNSPSPVRLVSRTSIWISPASSLTAPFFRSASTGRRWRRLCVCQRSFASPFFTTKGFRNSFRMSRRSKWLSGFVFVFR